MNERFHQRAYEVFRAACDLAPDQRTALLDRECSDDAELRQHVDQLLSHESQISESSELLDRPLFEQIEGLSNAERIGRYRIVSELGRGGQGVVYLCEDTELGRKVALKVMTGFGRLSKPALQRFRREAEVASRLEHPAICSVYDSGAEDGLPFIAMRYVEGQSLSRWIASSQTRPDRDEIVRIVRLIAAVAHALHAAHEAGVIHRDVQPGNIMVTPTGDPVILDFGLARELEDDLPPMTRTDQILGTPSYMSPEQISGKVRELDRRTDVYSLGVVLYEALTGERPFRATTRESLYHAILRTDAADPIRLNAAIPKDLRVVIATALDKDPDRRYQTAGAFADDLLRVAELQPIHAKAPSLAARCDRWIRRNRAVSALVATIVVGLIVGLLWTASKNKELVKANRELLLFQGQAELEELQTGSLYVWPAVPERIPRFERWLEKANRLVARIPEHQRALDELRQRSYPLDDSDPSYHRTMSSIDQLTLARAEREAQLADENDPAVQQKLRDLIRGIGDDLATERDSLQYGFDDPDLRARHALYVELVSNLKLFRAIDLASMANALQFARTVKERSIDRRTAAWQNAIDAVAAHPDFGGLRLAPQTGLVPLGSDPKTGLQEFLHLQSHEGDVPTRGVDGSIPIDGNTGLIFVLLPGGTFEMGAQQDAAEQPNYDPGAEADEGPVHAVTLAPFLISKYEMTQGQWRRFTGSNPSYSIPTRSEAQLHPVEGAAWIDCHDTLRKLGLTIPTEAQWEFAARAGTNTPWSTADGSKPDHLASDSPSRRRPHVAVDKTPANAFGVHGVHGNLAEYCRDYFGSYDLPVRDGDGERIGGDSHKRVIRGGSTEFQESNCRSAGRWGTTPRGYWRNVGLRPARALHR